MDIAMQELNGLDATNKIVSRFPDVKVIILSMYVNQSMYGMSLRSGASGYLLKDATPVELELAINSVNPRHYLSQPGISLSM
jgi:DNA-binding NarL/FixJ family response regulator